MHPPYHNSMVRSKIIHHLSKTPTHNVWTEMVRRCKGTNKKRRDYKNYAARGITVCERWQVFLNFLEDMGELPGPEYSIERKDNNKGYCPENCCWGLKVDQPCNRTNCIYITINGVTKIASQWERTLGLKKGAIKRRIRYLNWDPIKAATTPVRKFQ